MAIDERSRHELYVKLEAVLGEQEATTLMEHLPPVGWADVATKNDLVLLRSDLMQLRSDFRAELADRLSAQTRTMMLAMSTQLVAVAGLAFAAARLI